MAKYIGKRLGIAILSLLCWQGYIFSDPGDSRKSLSGSKCVRTRVEMMEEEYGLHQPVLEQYVTYMKHLFCGDLGYSYQNPSESVAEIIKTILACDSQDWNSGDLTGSCPGNRIWDFPDVCQTQCNSRRCF